MVKRTSFLILIGALLAGLHPLGADDRPNERDFKATQEVLAARARKGIDRSLLGHRVYGLYIGKKYRGSAEIDVETAGKGYQVRSAITFVLGEVSMRLREDFTADLLFRPLRGRTARWESAKGVLRVVTTHLERNEGKIKLRSRTVTLAGDLVVKRSPVVETTHDGGVGTIIGAMDHLILERLVLVENRRYGVRIIEHDGKLKEYLFWVGPVTGFEHHGVKKRGILVVKASGAPADGVGHYWVRPGGGFVAFRPLSTQDPSYALIATTTARLGRDLGTKSAAEPQQSSPAEIVAAFYHASFARKTLVVLPLLHKEFYWNFGLRQPGIWKQADFKRMQFEKMWGDDQARLAFLVGFLRSYYRSIPLQKDSEIPRNNLEQRIDGSRATVILVTPDERVVHSLVRAGRWWRITDIRKQ